MKKFIAVFEAEHRDVTKTQFSCISWEQEGEEVDEGYVRDLIKNTTAVHFFRLMAGKQFNISVENINVGIIKIELFK